MHCPAFEHLDFRYSSRAIVRAAITRRSTPHALQPLLSVWLSKAVLLWWDLGPVPGHPETPYLRILRRKTNETETSSRDLRWMIHSEACKRGLLTERAHEKAGGNCSGIQFIEW